MRTRLAGLCFVIVGLSAPVAAQNRISDGQFRDLPVGPHLINPPGAWVAGIPNPPNPAWQEMFGWWVNPGGQASEIAGIPYLDGRRVLAIRWAAPVEAPSPGNPDPVGLNRPVILEYHGVRDVTSLSGQRVRFSFWALSETTPVVIAPVIWISYDDSVYWLIPCRPVTIQPGPWATSWQPVACAVTLPSLGDRPLGSLAYVGVGVVLVETTQVSLLLAEFALFVGE